MDGSSEPLLPVSGSTEDPELGEPTLDVQSAIYRAPDKAVRYLTGAAAKHLGSFTVKDATVRQMLQQRTVLTLGASSKNIDWKTVWQRKLDEDDSWDARQDRDTAPMEVEAFVVDVKNAVHADDQGILNPLIKRHQAGLIAQRVFASPAVKALISFKWNTWAGRFLYFELSLYLLWLVSFQAFCLLFQDEDTSSTLRQLLHTRRGLVSVCLEGLALVGMFPFLWIELSTLIEYGPWGWLNTWNVLDCLTYAGQVLVTVMHLTRWHINSNQASVLIAFQVLLLWLKVQYFARVLQPSEQPFMETLRSVCDQVKWFLFLLLLTVWGFACAFYILFRKDQGQSDDFDTIWHSLLTMVGVMLGGPDLKTFYGSHNAGVCIALLLVYVFAMSLVLLNCLIGIMANACSRVSENNESVFYFSRACIIDELEASLPSWFRGIWADSWYPAYVHYLQVNIESADANLLDELTIDGKDGDEGGEGDGKQPPGGDLAARVSAMEAQLTRIADLQEAIAKSTLGKAYTAPASPGNGPGDGNSEGGYATRLTRMITRKRE